MPRSLCRSRLLLALIAVLLAASPLAAATRTWTGAASTQWSNAANWGGVAPAAGDDLVFPAGGANQATVNDYATGMTFNSISVTGTGYTLSGSPITLGAGGLSVSVTGVQISLAIALNGSQTWQTTVNTADFIDSGNINLNGATLTLAISSTFNTTKLTGVIFGNGAIVKNSFGELEFDGLNTYAGPTTLNAGYLRAGSSTAMGIADGTLANGTTVNSGGSFSVGPGVTFGNEYIAVTGPGQSNNGAIQNGSCGTSTYTGPIVLSGSVVRFSACGPGGAMILNGPISGSATQIDFYGASPITLGNGANSFTGQLVLNNSGFAGTTNLTATNAIPAAVTVDVQANQTLNLNNFNDTIAGLTGNGNVNLGSGTLTITGTQAGSFDGVISGTGNVTLNGAQTLALSGANTATGTLTDNGSTLLILGGTWPGPVVYNNGSAAGLANGATVGPVTVNSGAQVTPGGGGSGIANTGNLTLVPGGLLHLVINGTSSGSFSQLNVTGSVNLGNATLIPGASATLPAGSQLVIINNDGADPVVGTFNGLPEGASFNGGNGQMYTISYVGGTGNDVVLTALVAGTATTTTLGSSVNPSTVGQNVTFTATVSPNGGSPTPTGTVDFYDGATLLGSGAVNGAGQATFSTSALTQGSHPISAVYNGDANFTGSTSAVVNQQVNPVAAAGTTTSVNSSVNPSFAGQPVTFTATVTPSGGGTPTGTVDFYDGATLLGSGAVNGSGQATYTTSALAVGPHSITATYSGDPSFTGSTSPVLTQVVNPAAAIPALDARALLALAALLAVAGAWLLKR